MSNEETKRIVEIQKMLDGVESRYEDVYLGKSYALSRYNDSICLDIEGVEIAAFSCKISSILLENMVTYCIYVHRN